MELLCQTMPIPAPKTRNPDERHWDEHAQFLYFKEKYGYRIRFFLEQRLKGRNLDLGGGSYLSYPNSVVVDVSSVALARNPAKDKLHFDLDEIAEGARLPFEDHSFDSATMVSLWYCLRHPEAVITELGRVLRPGAELYIIDNQWRTYTADTVVKAKTKRIGRLFRRKGYDTLIECVPGWGANVKEIMSLCVAMPEQGAEGKVSRIKRKEEREEKDGWVRETPLIFLDQFADWELSKRIDILLRLTTYPITRYYKDYCNSVEAFSQEFHDATGAVPLFSAYGIEPVVKMLADDDTSLPISFTVIGEDRAVEDGYRLALPFAEKHGLELFDAPGILSPFKTVGELISYCSVLDAERADEGEYDEEEDFYRGETGTCLYFMGGLPLNSFTKDLQERMYDAMRTRLPDLDERITREKAEHCYYDTVQFRQRRHKMEDVLAKLDKISRGEIEVVGEGRFNFAPYMPRMREMIVWHF
jgi:SAM-dependent methyltransferase